MRILYVTANGFPRSDLDPRGTFSLEHAQALQAEGCEVHALDLRGDRFARDDLSGLSILRMPPLRSMLRRGDLRGLMTFAKTLRTIRSTLAYDWVIFGFCYNKYIPYLALFKKKGARVLLLPYGGEVMPASWVRRQLKKILFGMADLATPISEYTETLLSCLIGRRRRDDRKIVTLSAGVNLPKLQREARPRDVVRAELGITADDFVVLSICNLVKRKGVDVIIGAVHQLRQQGLPARHVIIGGGPELENLRRQSAAYGRPEDFIFIQSVAGADLASYYRMADVFAMLSTTDWETGQTEGYGITYAEAMAVGTPAIGGASCGASQPIKNGFNGYLVNPHAPHVVDEVSGLLQRLASDPEERRRLSQNAERHVRDYLTWRDNARLTLAAMRWPQP